ncbi:ImmA/IrrE family metallo-endopeptidase [Streptococcus sp. Marseille-P6264]|uniref:ImmA/IrrE family metallo-endopeptidase n=1 Tax=Streptococcus sp. Marseille-P6264 TaxID=2487315 RepID=UPI0011E71C0A|nr:ImmA/IrrE family metallo-endopeptidase [Streptococcus sp. Marseille-P6264]
MTNLKEYLDEDVKSLLEKKDFKFDDFNVSIDNPQIDVKKIAESLGCKIKYSFLISKAGSHNIESKEITVNELDPDYRQRFTIAHEIGHNVYDHSGVRNRITKDQKINKTERSFVDILIERQANDFASKLLMPEKLLLGVKKYLEDNKEIRNERQVVTKLADKFNVSYIAMEYRLKAVINEQK